MDDLISKLSEIRSEYNCFDEDEEPPYRALSEAIRILSQRADGDTISRQSAIDALWEKRQALNNYMEILLQDGKMQSRYLAKIERNRIEEDINIVEALPSAEHERNKGKWIRITQGIMPEKYICPFCHRTVESYGPEELLSIRYPYCHCGADMRGDAY